MASPCSSTASTSAVANVVGGHGQGGEELGPGHALGLRLVEQAQGPLRAARRSAASAAHARVMYSPERVSTLMRSPGFTNSGTWSTRPVSRVAGLRAPDTRSPCTPGSVSVTLSSTAAGRSDADDLVAEHHAA